MMKNFLSLMSPAALGRLITRLKADRKGNVLMIMGFAAVPLTFSIGFGIDYARAMRLQTQLNAAADAAALAAVSPAMILLTDSDSSEAATKMFNSRAALLNNYQDLQMTPTISNGTTGSGNTLGYLRKVTVSYTVKSVNLFGGVLGVTTLPVSGSASASAAQPPNVDFYLAMDNSPSMLLPATSDGIAKIIAATSTSHLTNGCAFACHAMLPHTDNIYVNDLQSRQILLSTSYYTTNSSQVNTYYRWNTSTSTLYDSSGNSMNSSSTSVSGPTRTTTGNGNNQKYVDTTVTTVTTTTYSITDSTSGPVTITKTVGSTSTTTKVTTPVNGGSSTTTTTTASTTPSSTTYDTGYWADGYWLTHNYGAIYGTPTSILLRKDDMVSAATQLIPFAADQAATYEVTYRAQMFSFDWTKSGSSSPVKTLNTLTDVASYSSSFSAASLFPTDDYWWKNNQPSSSTSNSDRATEMTNMLTAMNSIIPTAGTGASGDTPQKILFIITDGMLDQPNGSGRYFGPLRSSDLSQCTTIKAKGIKIAILYTQYLPESLVGDTWSQTNVAPYLSPSDQVLAALQSCASPGINGSPLVQTVTADGDITTALQQLFSTALQTARLVQ